MCVFTDASPVTCACTHMCVAVCCNVLQQIHRVSPPPRARQRLSYDVCHTATHCNTLQHTATHCNTLQQTATHCASPMMYVTLQYVTHCNTLQHTATHCNTLQHTATHCNTLSYEVCHTTVCNSALQCDAVCCRVLQVVAVDSPCVNSARSSPGCYCGAANTLQRTATQQSSTLQHTATRICT